jgi:UDP-GlcNAc:undecaprenyl-phosphate GlcNAc-1-phosphate transferase
LNNLLVFFTALAISVGIIPVMIRLAPRLGMVDMPDPRKVHAMPVPRVGGAGIVLGALIPLALLQPLDHSMIAYVLGSVVLFGFGAWDDSHELGHYVKFIGQFIAVLTVVYYGDVYVKQLPFMDTELAPTLMAKPFTVFAMVGMINAINHSDGLDGLAGGLSVLSLGSIAYLAYLAEGYQVVSIAFAVLGGVVGFLRYNTHPARVFMGDSGSQFLGFTMGFLAVLLTRDVNTALSAAVPALLLGLPIMDILAVFAQRVYHRMNWFRATRNHIHHRLLELGFHHYEAVVIIYSIQLFFVVSAIFLCYESDALILSLYLVTCAAVFVFLTVAERNRWRAHSRHGKSRFVAALQSAKQRWFFTTGTTAIVAVVIPLMFLGTSVLISKIPRDFGFSSSVLAAIMALLLIVRSNETIALRAISYITAAFVVYLETRYFDGTSTISYGINIGLYVLLAVAIWLAVRYASDAEFKVSPMDFLVIFIVLAVGVISRDHLHEKLLGIMAVKLVVLFYGCEIIYAKLTSKWNSLNIATLITLSILGAKSLA